ncbi:MAG: tetratricopeptide repeat protein [Spirochaetales bacterium]|nr:tetratricopeptide repeat protein [Spirochaetales bacterium]
MKRFIIVVFIIFAAFQTFCEEPEPKSLTTYLSEGKKAIEAESFDKAVQIFDEAEAAYPNSYLPNSYKGDLYKKYDLYKSAIGEYEKALKKQTKSITLYDDLAECYSNQGDEEKAIEIYKRALAQVYNSSDLYNSLAWSYIKTNRIDESLSTLKTALDNYPNSSDLLVTLGSAYYSADDYENARKAYMSSEYYSFRQGKSSSFRAIVKYNQASLEHSFGHYEEAMKTADSANAYSQRSSAHILQAEMFFNMLDFDKSLQEVHKASQLQPVTLYPEQILTRIYMLTNQVNKAEAIISRLEHNSDHKWLSSFSTSLDDYFAHVYSQAAELYEIKAHISFAEYDNPINAILHKYLYRLRSFIYRIKYANICLKTGRRQIDGGSVSSGLENLYEAYSQFDILSGKALKVLNILAERETLVRPFTMPKYNIMRSDLHRKSSLLYTKSRNEQVILENMKQINPKWERVSMADGYLYLIDSSRGKRRQEYISRLFMMCPSVVAGHGLNLDAHITFVGTQPQNEAKLLRQLKHCRIRQNVNADIKLMIHQGDSYLTIVAQDSLGKTITFTKDLDSNEHNLAKQIWQCIFVK